MGVLKIKKNTSSYPIKKSSSHNSSHLKKNTTRKMNKK